MKRAAIFCILVLLFTAQLACSLLTPRPNAVTAPLPSATAGETPLPVDTPLPAPTFTALPVEETPASGQISLELLKNFTYWVEDFNMPVKLTGGVYSDDQIRSQLVEPVALGDLNGDGRTDAAVILIIDPGGSGTFYYLATVLDQDGSPAQAGFASIGDRQGINDLQIVNGRIVLDYLTQGLSDPLCCPSERRLRSYLLEGDKLRLASEQVLDGPAAQATPLPNAILIDQPVTANPLTNPLPVRGRVSQVPPEKKLVYSVTDFNGALLDQGEVPVEGEPGGPGTFAFELTLEPGSAGLVQLELVDAAGGILRGRSTVVLVAEPFEP